MLQINRPEQELNLSLTFGNTQKMLLHKFRATADISIFVIRAFILQTKRRFFQCIGKFILFLVILTMSKRNFVGLSAKGTQNKKSRDSFNLEWLKVEVTTDTPDFKNVKVELSSIYEYSFENGLKCKICAACSSSETNTANEYATGKR